MVQYLGIGNHTYRRFIQGEKVNYLAPIEAESPQWIKRRKLFGKIMSKRQSKLQINQQCTRTCSEKREPRRIQSATVPLQIEANTSEEFTTALYAGHKYPSATERYLRKDISEQRKLINKFHPLG